MNLEPNARVYTASGEEIGKISRFVLDPHSRKVTHIVIQRGLFNQEERELPLNIVQHTDEQGLHLADVHANMMEELPAFEETRYVTTDEDALLGEEGYVSDAFSRRYFYYPPAPFGAAGMLRPDDMYLNNPPAVPSTATSSGVPVTGEPSVHRETEQNIPEGTVAVKEGAKVLSRDGRHIGSVDKMIIDPHSQKATHFVIAKGLLVKERKIIPLDWVRNFGENEVSIEMDENFINRLPDVTGEV